MITEGLGYAPAAVASPAELRARTGRENLEEAFVEIIGTEQGLLR